MGKIDCNISSGNAGFCSFLGWIAMGGKGKGTVVDPSCLFDLPMVRQCLLAAFDLGSQFHALKGNHHLNELLIKKHVLPEAEALSLFDAAREGDLRAVHLVLNWTMTPVDFKNSMGFNALIWAAIHGRTEVVGILIEAGADMDLQDRNGTSALHIAVPHGHTEVVGILIEA